MSLLLVLALVTAPTTDVCESQRDDAIIKCAQDQFVAADAEMNQIWKRLKKYPNLIRVQRLWLAYRDLDCETRNPADKSGSLFLAFKYGCLAELTKLRVEDLRELSAR